VLFGYAESFDWVIGFDRSLLAQDDRLRESERYGEAEEVAAGRGDGAGGEQTSEIDDIEAVIQVFNVGLQPQRARFFFVNFRASGNVYRKRRADPSVGEINAG
jgi:hypothetical protein